MYKDKEEFISHYSHPNIITCIRFVESSLVDWENFDIIFEREKEMAVNQIKKELRKLGCPTFLTDLIHPHGNDCCEECGSFVSSEDWYDISTPSERLKAFVFRLDPKEALIHLPSICSY